MSPLPRSVFPSQEYVPATSGAGGPSSVRGSPALKPGPPALAPLVLSAFSQPDPSLSGQRPADPHAVDSGPISCEAGERTSIPGVALRVEQAPPDRVNRERQPLSPAVTTAPSSRSAPARASGLALRPTPGKAGSGPASAIPAARSSCSPSAPAQASPGRVNRETESPKTATSGPAGAHGTQGRAIVSKSFAPASGPSPARPWPSPKSFCSTDSTTTQPRPHFQQGTPDAR